MVHLSTFILSVSGRKKDVLRNFSMVNVRYFTEGEDDVFNVFFFQVNSFYI